MSSILSRRRPRHPVPAGLFAPLALLLAALAGPAHADATYDGIQSRQSVRIGVNLSGLPFGTYEPGTSNPVGYAVDLARDVGAKLGVATEIVPVVAANRALFLQQGKVDLLIANMTLTPGRADNMDYVPTPYEQLGGAAVVRKGSAIRDWGDLRGQPVCMSQGASFQTPLTETYQAVIKAFRTQSESLLALRGNNCVAAVLNSPIMHELIRKPEWSDYEIPIPTDLIPQDSVIWVRKGETQTRDLLDRIVQDWHRSGLLLQTARKFNMQPSPLVVELRVKYRALAPLATPVRP
ncbi:MAG: ABC transporter glutamine-binding protein GlnH [Paracidovorax wautersii]|uniref:ABC transporter glutamine-binding protein GlnH n=1 Tax=Paracidovorax wautersii TaxID=1177982 RepID=A0A7V8FRV9_9BURK|nr:MAG: ABC transporter glutamine-binding protein GlnH [Paracidovorax wautersii]